MDGTGSGLCPVVGFGIGSAQTLCSATRGSVSNLDLSETECECMSWMKLAQDPVLCIGNVELLGYGTRQVQYKPNCPCRWNPETNYCILLVPEPTSQEVSSM